MDKNRMWVIGSVLAMVAVLLLGWVAGIQPQLAAAATADDERSTVEQTNIIQEAALAKLKEDFAGIDALKATLVPLAASVPSGTEAPAFVSQIDALAVAHGVTLAGITMADPVAYTPVVPPAAVAADGTDAAAAAADAPVAGSAEAVPTPEAAVAGAPPVTNSQITATNFASLAVSIDVSGSYTNVLNFVSALQSGTRLFMVTGLKTAAVADAPGEVTATISGFIYSLVAEGAATEVGAG